MGRWRPKAPSQAAYITVEGATRLQSELKHLWKIERPELTDRIKAAAANGDRSENGDYIYGKMRLREIDRRIRYLSKRLDALTVVERPPPDQSRVRFGAWVNLEKESGEQFEIRIVGFDEIDSSTNWISLDSPLGRSLVGKTVDDEISYQTPQGTSLVYVISIRYQ